MQEDPVKGPRPVHRWSGLCFESAAKHAMDEWGAAVDEMGVAGDREAVDRLQGMFRIAHCCVYKGSGKHRAHAWMEMGDPDSDEWQVIDRSWAHDPDDPHQMYQDDWYDEVINVDRASCRYYSPTEAVGNYARTGCWGPWHDMGEYGCQPREEKCIVAGRP